MTTRQRFISASDSSSDQASRKRLDMPINVLTSSPQPHPSVHSSQSRHNHAHPFILPNPVTITPIQSFTAIPSLACNSHTTKQDMLWNTGRIPGGMCSLSKAWSLDSSAWISTICSSVRSHELISRTLTRCPVRFCTLGFSPVWFAADLPFLRINWLCEVLGQCTALAHRESLAC